MSNQLAFFLGSIFASVLLAIFQHGAHDERVNCTSSRVRQLSPHEQQPEPIPAAAQGGLSVERWVM